MFFSPYFSTLCPRGWSWTCWPSCEREQHCCCFHYQPLHWCEIFLTFQHLISCKDAEITQSPNNNTCTTFELFYVTKGPILFTFLVCFKTFHREYLTLPNPKSQDKNISESSRPQQMFKVSLRPLDGQNSSDKRTFMVRFNVLLAQKMLYIIICSIYWAANKEKSTYCM